MADGETTLKIDQELASRLREAAKAAGQTFEAYAKTALEAYADHPVDWDEVDRICDETIAKGDGLSLEEIGPWLDGWGKPDGPPRPR